MTECAWPDPRKEPWGHVAQCTMRHRVTPTLRPGAWARCGVSPTGILSLVTVNAEGVMSPHDGPTDRALVLTKRRGRIQLKARVSCTPVLLKQNCKTYLKNEHPSKCRALPDSDRTEQPPASLGPTRACLSLTSSRKTLVGPQEKRFWTLTAGAGT